MLAGEPIVADGRIELASVGQGTPQRNPGYKPVGMLPQFSGRAAAMGFCYGGPYAILGPKRLGYDAGISCHGTRMQDFIGELDGVTQPVCIMWGDQDHAAPAGAQAAYRAVPGRTPNAEVHIFPGVLHGYMMPGNAKAFHPEFREFSTARALAILDGLRGGVERLRLAA